MTACCRYIQQVALCTKHKLEVFKSYHQTREQHEVPLVFRENYIHTGYRMPDRPWIHYLSSLFAAHNETINIWSHLIATVIFFFKAYDLQQKLDFEHDPLAWPVLGFAIGTVAYALCSTFAHMFQSKSKLWHYTCFQIDYIGIGLNGYGNASLLFYLTGTKVYYRIFSTIFMPCNVLLAIIVSICFGVAKLRYRRPYPFQRKLWQIISCSLHVLFGSVPLWFKIFEYLFEEYDNDDCSIQSILRHLEYTFWFTVATFFFASGIPERFAPGRFDIVGHGHQFFHIIITYTSLVQYKTTELDLECRPRDLVDMVASDRETIFGGITVILAANILFIFITHPYRVVKVQDDAKYDSLTVQHNTKQD